MCLLPTKTEWEQNFKRRYGVPNGLARGVKMGDRFEWWCQTGPKLERAKDWMGLFTQIDTLIRDMQIYAQALEMADPNKFKGQDGFGKAKNYGEAIRQFNLLLAEATRRKQTYERLANPPPHADFVSVALGCGGTAHHWSQLDFIGQSTLGKQGVCGPLAVKWIKDRKCIIHFEKDCKTQDGREEIMQLKLNQSANPNWDSEYLELFGLIKILRLDYPSPVSISEVLKFLSAGAGYYLVGISSRGVVAESTAHALGIDMCDHKFFDPNYGQAHFKNTNDLKNFFALWFRLEYLNLHGGAFVTWYY